MRCEEGPAAELVVDVLRDRPGQRDSVVGARPAADLVEDHEAAVGGGVENPRRLGHLDHERALAAAELVARPDAGKDPVRDPDRRSGSPG